MQEDIRKNQTIDDRTCSREARELAIAMLERQVEHVKDNANNLRRFEGMADEARCRELAGLFLWDIAQAIRVGFQLDEIEKIMAAADARVTNKDRGHG